MRHYCREIETYLCRKNDGHLIRVVGPSFERVSSWAAQGIPLRIAFAGIDRYFDRYYKKGARRRPIRIDFCEADVLDVFDEWRRALGLTGAPESIVDNPQSTVHSSARFSLPAHLERVVLRLTQARAKGSVAAQFDAVIDGVARELDAARAGARGLRGAARQELIERLAALDAELLEVARGSLDEASRADLAREAEEELAGFQSGMSPNAFSRARQAAADRLIRERLALPTVSFTQG